MHKLTHGDCLEWLKSLPDNYADSIVTDPPYLIGFMGAKWDSADGIAGRPEVWKECLRVLKPGGHLLAFGGSRTYHRIACAIEDGGFEIRDQIMWLYGSGFPKSLDVSKAIDKKAGAERKVVGFNSVAAAKANKRPAGPMNARYRNSRAANDNGATITAPVTDSAQQWQGWGTAFKPAHEPIVVARKPLIGTVAENVLEFGTGAINIDGCRVPTTENPSAARRAGKPPKREAGTWANDRRSAEAFQADKPGEQLGRWPANVIHDGSDEVLEAFARYGQKPGSKPAVMRRGATTGTSIGGNGRYSTAKPHEAIVGYGDDGTAARFFYTAKPSKKERGDGNTHTTVKPLALMRYLSRLVTPPGGLILDPFAGSASGGVAAIEEGFRWEGCELLAEHVAISESRLANAKLS